MCSNEACEGNLVWPDGSPLVYFGMAVRADQSVDDDCFRLRRNGPFFDDGGCSDGPLTHTYPVVCSFQI